MMSDVIFRGHVSRVSPLKKRQPVYGAQVIGQWMGTIPIDVARMWYTLARTLTAHAHCSCVGSW